MNKINVAFILSVFSFSTFPNVANAEQVCKVTVCNKIERISLNVFSHIKDSIGENCFEVIMPKKEAIVGKELSSESRWYQGSFNPSKKSVTTIEEVGKCKEFDME